MSIVKKQVTEAVILLEKKQYIQATEKLKALYEQEEKNELIIWALSLSYIGIGEPFRAIPLLDSINDSSAFPIAEQKKAVLESLPVYENVAKIYNQALQSFKQDAFTVGYKLLKPLLKVDNILPVDVYKALVLSGILADEKEEIQAYIRQMPIHIQQLPEVKQVLFLAEGSSEKKKPVNKVVLLLGTVLTVLILLLIMPFFQKEKEELVTPPEDQLSTEQTVYENDKEIEQLQKAIISLEEQLNSETVKEDNGDSPYSLFSPEEIKEVFSSVEKESYEKGLFAYKQGDYEEALILLEKSLAVNDDAYYSDDAMYFLFKSQVAQQLYNEAIHTGHQFLEKNNEAFEKSPYRDAMMLDLAEVLMDEEVEEARSLLLGVVEQYPDEWTGAIAKRKLVELE